MSERLLAGVVTPIARQSYLGELTYERLKEIIVSGAFPPNEKLTVRSVAAALGVSTTPARDAINRLLSEGALINEGPKTVVLPSLTFEALDEITATRLALEGLAAERSVLAVAPADIAVLEQMQVAINAGLDAADYREVLKVNREFHFLIYRMSGWPRLVAMIESLWLRVGPSFNELYPDFATNRRGVANHLLAMQGLRAKDGAKVRSAMEQDIRDGYVRLKNMIRARR
ncbi:DNA-binding transcriptional regulator, GntR family [Bradyrhizobium shewense]|uniref:DNA-binding transcriptional regulator, GntR family n=1 Tax=Bradyrhizobium shewense TaxID=1761772 RepID=A0A1C3WSQ6_9BRAD|nr:GntR family transcriptional regulator [Bradyrhizobium shewense]SCB42925.1 DNA-binding transcriptional regulator, GntR family [Bradyrhizobium shewense]